MQHGSEHSCTVWPILLLHHLYASCVPVHKQAFFALQQPGLLCCQSVVALQWCKDRKAAAAQMLWSV